MARLRWCKQRRKKEDCGLAGQGKVEVDYTDLIPVRDILGPVFLTEDASAGTDAEDHFLFNHWVR